MRHKQSILRESDVVMRACDLRVGDYAVICDADGDEDGHRGGELVLKAYGDVLVTVANPLDTWTVSDANTGPFVKRLKEGTKVTIMVQNER